MLMVIFDLTDGQAFELLRWHSSTANVKLRHVAATLVDRLVDPDLAGLQPRQRLTAILAGLRSSGAPETPAQGNQSVPAVQQPPTPDEPSVDPIRRIRTADLPRILTRAIAAAAQSITIVDWQARDQPLVYVNDAFARLTGYSTDQILGRNCRFLQGPDTDPAAVSLLHQALARGNEIRTVLLNYRRDGHPFWNEVHLSAVRDRAGRITHYVGYQSDVSERVEREQQLRHLLPMPADPAAPAAP
jgi:PAS domain S-box-containing protein